ncbi:hypothetical protein PsorP6_008691 [Peronosclerospora sorghi]|uniref:Uncharacterized protein n=1 Tax=Peronosclerospora sorghi TaxID=230839 RepID=A0ACC0W068_9STRA|nr:hypothetical protein PsorP6_008691 [Peronosclerospora sorghi]
MSSKRSAAVRASVSDAPDTVRLGALAPRHLSRAAWARDGKIGTVLCTIYKTNSTWHAPNRVMSLRRFDLNVKGVDGIQERTIGGGLLTIVSCAVVALLLLSEFTIWWTVSVTHRMHVDTDPVSPLQSPLSAL